MSLIVLSWLLFSGVVYVGFSAVEQVSRLVATITGGEAAPNLDDVTPAAGEAEPAR